MATSIQDQIQQLQRRQAKVEMFRYMKELLSGTEDSSVHSGLKEEILKTVLPFFDAQIKATEEGEVGKSSSVPVVPSSLSDGEISLVKALLNRLAASPGVGAIQPNPPVDVGGTSSQHATAGRQDKVRFAMAHQHLANKRVSVVTKDGPVKGVVQGLDAPNIIVKLDTGYTVPFEASLVVGD